MEEIMRMPAVAIKPDQHFSANRDIGNAELSTKQFYDGLSIRRRNVVTLDEPIRDRGVIGTLSDLRIQLRPQLADGACESGSKRHLCGVPTRHRRQFAVRALDISFLDAGIDQPHDASPE